MNLSSAGREQCQSLEKPPRKCRPASLDVVLIGELDLWPTVRYSSVHQLEGASDLVDKALLAEEGTLGAWAPRVGRDGGQELDGKGTLKAQSLGVPHFLLHLFGSSWVTSA